MSEDPKYAKMFTRGGQITFNNLRMLIQVNQTIVHGALILTLLVTACCIYLITPALTIKMAYYYYLSELLVRLGSMHHVFSFMWQGSLVKVSTLAVLEEQYFREQANIFMHDLKIGLFLGVGLSIVLIVIFSSWLIRRGRKQAEKKYVRGAKMDSLVNVAKAIRKHGASDIVISDLPMVKNFEVQHVLIHGTTGSGKGQTFNQFIEQIRERKDSAIIFDKGCVFTSSYYNYKTDVILNPFDTRCAGWDLWAEAKTEPDFENIAASLIPMHGEGDPYWVDAARTVFSATAYRMRSDADRSLDKLLSLILTAELDVLGDYLKGTQAATLVSGKIEKTAISIRSVISTYLKSLRFMQGLENREKFAIRDWINQISDATSSNFLFISSNAEQHASIRPLISTWLSIASIALLSLDENFERRIWFICDELPTLHKLPQLGETIAEVRKFGGCFILGMQSISQLQKIYGRSAAAEMFDLLNTRFFYRSPSSDMANVVSKELGQEDIELSNESYSYGSNTIRDGISIGDQRITRPLVTPAEIMELPDLTAYVRVPAPVPITKIAITYTKPKRVCAGFILREELKDISEEIAHNAINNTDAQNTDEVFDTSKPEIKEQNDLSAMTQQQETENSKSVSAIELD